MMPSSTPPPELPPDRNQLSYVHRWRAVIDTQMHFNDMLLRTRSIGLSTVAAVYSAAIVSRAARSQGVVLSGLPVNVGSALLIFGIMLLGALLVLDRFYYYRMLVAAVQYGEEIERESGSPEQPIELGLTRRISASVTVSSSSMALWLLYIIPMVAGIVLLFSNSLAGWSQ